MKLNKGDFKTKANDINMFQISITQEHEHPLVYVTEEITNSFELNWVDAHYLIKELQDYCLEMAKDA